MQKQRQNLGLNTRNLMPREAKTEGSFLQFETVMLSDRSTRLKVSPDPRKSVHDPLDWSKSICTSIEQPVMTAASNAFTSILQANPQRKQDGLMKLRTSRLRHSRKSTNLASVGCEPSSIRSPDSQANRISFVTGPSNVQTSLKCRIADILSPPRHINYLEKLTLISSWEASKQMNSTRLASTSKWD